MLLFSNAKINLGLRVVEKRPDGYHNIETIMIPLGFADLLEFTDDGSQEVTYTNTGLQVNCAENENLVIKAYHLIREDFNIPGISIHLHKLIPPGAGLGGGSSNGAYMLRGLNEHFNLGLDDYRLEKYAAMLGSDCPLFIRNTPCLASGRGEKLINIQLPLKFYLVLLYPGFPVSTGEAYKGIIPHKEEISLTEVLKINPDNWKNTLKNQFEDTVFSLYPRLQILKSSLYNHGAFYASMTGSGSAVYGLFREKPALSKELEEIRIWEGEV